MPSQLAIERADLEEARLALLVQLENGLNLDDVYAQSITSLESAILVCQEKIAVKRQRMRNDQEQLEKSQGASGQAQ